MSLFVVSNLFNQVGSRHEVVAIEERNPGAASFIVRTALFGNEHQLSAIKVEVPMTALAELSDGIMKASKQMQPVDASHEGLIRMEQEYNKGPWQWKEFIAIHTL